MRGSGVECTSERHSVRRLCKAPPPWRCGVWRQETRAKAIDYPPPPHTHTHAQSFRQLVLPCTPTTSSLANMTATAPGTETTHAANDQRGIAVRMPVCMGCHACAA
eukprot:362520-Chlamydomonas_euryale.AAC.7